jgi:ATP-dependent protease ClpP protease subunit
MATPKWFFALRGQGTQTLELDIFSDIGESYWGDSVSAKDVRSILKQSQDAKLIKLKVNSRGGDVFDGFAIYNLLNDHPARVEADIVALAASMASVVVMAADEIVISHNAMMMIHNPWGFGMGDAEEMRALADLLDKLGGQIADSYAARSGMSRDDALTLMNAETWLTADEAKAKGLVDMVKPSRTGPDRAEALARLDIDGLGNAPRVFAAAVSDARAEARKQREERAAVVAAGEQASSAARAAQVRSNEEPKDASAATRGGAQEKQKMEPKTVKELRAQYPQLCDELADAERAAGIKAEKDRVNAHLTMGQHGGDEGMKIALANIESGAGFDLATQAKYMVAAKNGSDRNKRQGETDAADKAIEGAIGSEVVEAAAKAADLPAEDAGDKAWKVMAARRGKKVA